MARKTAKSCNHPDCPNLAYGPFCDEHTKDIERVRGSAASRGYDRKWREARESFLRLNPLCVECEREGRVEPATVVDHIKPHKGDKRLFWLRSNWQSLCVRHHGIKTVKSDGGFGNAIVERLE